MGSLPNLATAMVGRESELETLVQTLSRDDVRLVTVFGAAGVGKTRLAIEAGRRLEYAFRDGAFFVDLAPLEEPDQLPGAIARVLGVEETPGVELTDALKRFAASRDALLFLDNFEQISAAAPIVAELAAAAVTTRIVVTSRVPLQISWERRLPLAGLPLPDADASAEASPAVRLFAERARALLPDFSVTEANAAAVAGICRTLDGVPLAIELAAARTDVQSPQAILAGLQENGLDLLSAGPRDLPERQQTLRSAIGWSERLLDAGEREVFNALAVFAQGFTAQAATYVAGDAARGILTALVRKSLLRFDPAEGQTGRYHMLVLVREFALEQLHDGENEPGYRLRHMEWCLTLAEAAAPHLRSAQQYVWMDLLELEHANLRAALAWCLRTNRTTEGLRFVAALGWFWQVRSHLAEGETWFVAFLDRTLGSSSRERRLALVAGAWLAHQKGERVLRNAYATEGLELARLDHDAENASFCLHLLARSLLIGGNVEPALELANEALRYATASGSPIAVRYALHFLCVASLRAGRAEEAREYGTQAAAMQREAGDDHYLLWTLGPLSQEAITRGDLAAARSIMADRLEVANRHRSPSALSAVYSDLAILAATVGEPERGARLLGIRDELEERAGSDLSDGPNVGPGSTLGAVLEAARQALGPVAFEQLKAEGRRMSLEEAFAYARADIDEPPPRAARGEVLTPREHEVAALVALGLTDPQIAERLVISPRTAERHVANILGKLELATRTQIATWVLEQRASPEP